MNEVITNNQEKCDRALAALHHVMDPEIGLNIFTFAFSNAHRKVDQKTNNGQIDQNSPGLCHPVELKLKEGIHQQRNAGSGQYKRRIGQKIAEQFCLDKNRNQLMAGTQDDHGAPTERHRMGDGQRPGVNVMLREGITRKK